MIRKVLLATLLVASFGANVAPASAAVYVRVAPPEPRVEVVPPPRHGYVWAPGYWNWRNNQHVWVGGRWVRERPGYAYNSPRWVEHEGRWRMEQGRWERR